MSYTRAQYPAPEVGSSYARTDRVTAFQKALAVAGDKAIRAAKRKMEPSTRARKTHKHFQHHYESHQEPRQPSDYGLDEIDRMRHGNDLVSNKGWEPDEVTKRIVLPPLNRPEAT